MRLLLGVDGGGTSTRAVVASLDGTVRGEGRAGPVNLQSVSEADVERALRACVADALAAAGAHAGDIAAACYGIAGAGRPDDAAVYTRILRGIHGAQPFELVMDCEIALDASTRGGPGAVLICGTGSVCFGRDAGGVWVRAGGWGPVIGDEGSGYEIGRSVLNACARAQDGLIAPTALTEAVLRKTGLSAMTDLPVLVRSGLGRAEIAALARCAFEAHYDGGDAAARAIVEKALADLVEIAAAVAQRIDAGAPVILAGGVFEHEPRFAGEVVAALRRRLPGSDVSVTDAQPVAGALWRAGRIAGASVVYLPGNLGDSLHPVHADTDVRIAESPVSPGRMQTPS